jgi:hypothetical protein
MPIPIAQSELPAHRRCAAATIASTAAATLTAFSSQPLQRCFKSPQPPQQRWSLQQRLAVALTTKNKRKLLINKDN